MCGQIRRLDPSRREFAAAVSRRIDHAMMSYRRIPPMRLEILKVRNLGLYKSLKLTEGGA